MSDIDHANSTSWPRFIIYRRTATSIARSEQGPLRHLVNDYRSESLPDHCFGTAYHLIDDAGGAHQLLGLTDQFTGQQAHLFEVTGKLWSWRKSANRFIGKSCP